MNVVDEQGARRGRRPHATIRKARKRNIIEVATREFAENGLAGARIDEIAAKTKSSKRMIYYYFGDKEGLYLQVLEAAYSKVRAVEATLDLDDLAPVEALRKLVGFTFDHHNSQRGVHPPGDDREHPPRRIPGAIEGDPGAQRHRHRHDLPALRARRAERASSARASIPIDLHWQISALCFFNVSNRATFSKIFTRDLGSKKALAHLRDRRSRWSSASRGVDPASRTLLRPSAIDVRTASPIMNDTVRL